MLVPDDQHPPTDRRTWPRVKVDRPCKVHDPRSRKYIAGTARDLSCGGALIEVDRAFSISPGDTLHVAIAQKRRQPLLRADDMIELRVVRALRTPEGRTMLAGQWIERALEAIPLRRAA